MEYTPIGSKVLLTEVKKETTHSSGLILQGADGATSRGKVVAIGPDVKTVKVGDLVYPEWSKGIVLINEDGNFLSILEENITAIVK
jgi:co-chaperonin GroES (HSP10)